MNDIISYLAVKANEKSNATLKRGRIKPWIFVVFSSTHYYAVGILSGRLKNAQVKSR